MALTNKVHRVRNAYAPPITKMHNIFEARFCISEKKATNDIDIAIPSVRLCVCDTPDFSQNS